MAGKILALFAVNGRARTKGSMNAYCMKNRAHTIKLSEQVKDSGLWRKRLAKASQVNQLASWGGLLGYSGAVEVRYVVWLPRTLSEAQGAAEGALTPVGDSEWPISVVLGDTDKFQRNLGDALEDSRLILNDAQITDWMAAKRWTDGAGRVEVMVCESENPDGGPWWMP